MDNKVLALVNGREITEFDLAQTARRFPRERQGYLNTEQGRKDLLEQIISFELMYNYALEEDMDEERDYLYQVENAKKEILTQYAISKVLSVVDVSDAEVKGYYEENMSSFIQEESVRARHILVDNLEDAEKIAKEIKEGMTFEEAANQYSNCPSKEQGGDLGTFTKGRMVPEFEKAAFEIEVGVVSEPVQTQFGYHLIKIEEKNSANVMPLSEVAPKIKNELLQMKQSEKFLGLTSELKNKFDVVIK